MQVEKLERKFAPNAICAVEADGTFTGYASLFGRTDLGGDAVEQGAFATTLARRGPGGVRMLYQHDPRRPIGRWLELREDHRGLFVRGQIAASAGQARDVLELMRCGALDGLSIGFRAVRTRRDPGRKIRRILEVDLWEISIVTFPMLPEARVQAVKTAPRPRILLTQQDIRPGLPDTIRRAAILLNKGHRHDADRQPRARNQVDFQFQRARRGFQRVHGRLRSLSAGQ